jgi:hypothetical protein
MVSLQHLLQERDVAAAARAAAAEAQRAALKKSIQTLEEQV